MTDAEQTIHSTGAVVIPGGIGGESGSSTSEFSSSSTVSPNFHRFNAIQKKTRRLNNK